MIHNYQILPQLNFRKQTLLTFVFLSFLGMGAFGQTTITYTGNGTFVVPAGLTTLTTQAWGGGGGGGGANSALGTSRGGGGGGGSYRLNAAVTTIVAGTSYPITVGTGGNGGAAGNNAGTIGGTSSAVFGITTVSAPGGNPGGGGGGGGTGGTGGAATNNGGGGATGSGTFGGGGGGGAGSTTAGTTTANGSGGAGGTGTFPGGIGGAGATGTNNGSPGSLPSGGGGGARSAGLFAGKRAGGAGAAGKVLITFTCPTYSLTSTSAVSPIGTGNTSLITLSSSAADLPTGTYIVTYDLSAPNAATGITTTITVTVAGTGTFTTGTLANAGTTTITITSLASGSVTGGAPGGTLCTSAIGANNTANISILNAPNATASSNSPFCVGGNLQLFGGDNGMVSYQWSGPSGYSSTDQNPVRTNATAGMAGTYTITVTDGLGITASTTTAVTAAVAINPIAGSNTPFCDGGTLNLTSSGTGGVSYLWSGPNGYSSTQQNPSINGAGANEVGTYTVTVTNGSGCNQSTTTTAVLATLPTISPSASVNPVCQGINFIANANPSGGKLPYSSFLWSTGSTLQNPTITASITQTYTVTVTDACGVTASNSFLLNVNSASVSISSVPANGSICGGGSVAMIASGSVVSYAWAPASDLNTAVGASVNSSAVATTTYTVTGTAANTCTATATQTITVVPKMIVTPTATPSLVCLNGSTTLTSNPANTTNYSVSTIPSNIIAPVSPQNVLPSPLANSAMSTVIPLPFPFSFFGRNNNQIFVSSNGFIQFQVNTGNTGVTGQTEPTATAPNNIIAGVWTDLNPSASGTVTYFTSGSTPNRVFVVDFTNVQIPTFLIGANGSASFQIQLFESDNHVEVQIASVVQPGVAIAGPTTVGLKNNTGAIFVGPAGFFNNGNWSSGATGFKFTPSGTVSPTPTFLWDPNTFLNSATNQNPVASNVTAATTYTVTASSLGCTATGSVDFTVTSPLGLSCGASLPNPVCSAASLSLSATPSGGRTPYTYLWSNGSTLQNPAVPSVSQTYTVTVTDNCGLTISCTQVIVATPTPTATIVGTFPTTLCGGSALTASTTAVSPSYQWLFNGNPVGTNSSTYAPTLTGSYSVIVTDNATVSNCSATSAAVNVTVSPAPVVNLSPNGTLNKCNGTTQVLNVTSTQPSTFNGGAITINGTILGSVNATPYPSSIGVANLSPGASVASVAINNFTIPVMNNVDMVLVSPTGVAVVLISDVGNSAITGNNYVLQDGAPSMGATAATSPVSGTYNCTNRTTGDNWPSPGPGTTGTLINPLLSSFTGNPNGTWNLFVLNDGALLAAAGSIGSWSITFNPPPFTYSWVKKPAGSTSIITPTNAPSATVTINDTATYVVTVTDTVSGCTNKDSITINGIPLPKPKILEPDTFICSNPGALNLHAVDTGAYSGGYPVGTYFDWEGSSGGYTLPYPGPDPLAVTPFSASTTDSYYVIVTLPSGGCSAISTVRNIDFSINQSYLSFTSQDSVKCFGTSTGSAVVEAFFGISGQGDFRYKWYNTSNSLLRDVTNSNLYDSLNNVPAGKYYVYIYNGVGQQLPYVNCETIDSIEVLQPAAPLAISETHPDTLCTGQTMGFVNISVTGGTPGYTYLWSNNTTDEDLANVGGGTYTVTVTDANGCTITVSATMQSHACGNIFDPCVCLDNSSGINDGQFSETVTVHGGIGPYTVFSSSGAYTTSSPAPPAAPIPVTNGTGLIPTGNPDSAQLFIYIVSGQAWTVTVHDAIGQEFTIGNMCSYPSSPEVIPAVVDLCLNDPAPLITSYVTGTNLTWYASQQGGQPIATPVINTSVVSNTTYYVSQDPASGCESARTPLTIVVNELPVANLSVTNVNCGGGSSGSITVTPTNGTGPYIVNMSPDPNNQNSLQPTNSPVTYTNLGPVQYTFIVTDAKGCTGTAQASITAPDEFYTEAVIQHILCFGETDGSIHVTSTGGTQPYSYVWSTGSTVDSIYNVGAGTYTLTATDANGCSVIYTYVINQPAQIAANGVAANVTCFGFLNGTIDLSPSGGTAPYTFLWNDFDTNEDRSGLDTGTYYVEISDFNNCTISVSFTITQPGAELIVEGISQNILCYGETDGTINITVAGGTTPYNYVWENGSTDEDRSNLAAGTYTVNVTDANGCVTMGTFTLTTPPPFITTGLLTNVSCFGFANGAIDITATGGTPPYTYLWNDFDSNEDRSGLDTGLYTVVVTDFNNCTSTASFQVTQPDEFYVEAVIEHLLCYGESDGYIDITTVGGTAPFTYQWSNGQTSEDIINLPAGTYTLTATDANGCVVSYTYVVNQPPTYLVTGVVTLTTCYGTADGQIDVTVTGGTGPYTYIWNDFDSNQDRSVLDTGYYTVTVTDYHNCTLSATFYVGQPDSVLATATITNVTCNGLSNGSITVNPTGGTPGYTYLWSNGETTQTISNLVVGDYTVIITDSHGCTYAMLATVTQPGDLLTEAVIQHILCFGETDGSIILTTQGGTLPYIYIWSTGETTKDIFNIGAGSYTVTVTDSLGCSVTTTYVVNQPPQLIIASTQVNVSCFGFVNGSIDITASGGVAPYTYSWSDFSTDEDRSALDTGLYILTVTDYNNCTATASFQITQPDEFHVEAVIQHILCYGETDGNIILTTIGGTAPFSYQWSNGETTKDIFNIGAGTYTVTITDFNGCVTSETYIVNQPPQFILTGVATNVSCFGFANGNIDITVTGGIPPYSFSWSDFSSTEDLAGLDTGTYTVTVTDFNNCTQTASFTITQPDELYVEAVIQHILCYGETDGNIVLTITGGTGPFSYQWSNGETTKDIMNIGAGTYTVTITDVNGCVTAQTYVVNQPPQLTVTGIQVNISCYGFADGQIDITAAGGVGPYTYFWSDFSTLEDISGLDVGTYTVTVTDYNNCSTTATFTITQPDELALQVIIQDLLCYGDNDGAIDLSVSGGTSPYTYVWEDLSTNEDRSGLVAGTYTVTVTDAHGCVISASYNVIQPTLLTVNGIIGNVSCNGFADGSISITAAGGTPGYTYAWSDFSTDEDRSGLDIGTYTVIVTDFNNCTATASFEITEPDELALQVIIQDLLCYGDDDGAIDLSVSGGTSPYTYVWEDLSTNEDRSGLVAGTYTVTVTDAHGCVISASYNVIQPTQVTVSGVVGNVSCNGFANGSITITASGGTAGYTYVWSDFSTDQNRTGLDVGTYTVIVSDFNNCTATASFTITEPDELALQAIIQDLLCFGDDDGSIDLEVVGGTGPFTYLWSNFETVEDIDSLLAGTYTVTVTDANGCVITQSFNVLQPTQLTVSGIIGNVSCNGNANGTIIITANGGTAPYAYLWDDFSTDKDRSGLDVGTYTVTVYDHNNCSATASFTITEPDELVLQSIIQDLLCFGDDDGAIDLTVIGGTSPFIYLWSNNETTEDISGLVAGTYTVTVTDANGCVISQSFNVQQPTQLTVSGIIGNVSCNGFANGTIIVTANGGTSPYTYLWDDFSTDKDRAGLDVGTYTVTVYDNNNCSATASFVVTEPDELAIQFITQDLLCFGDNDGQIDITVLGGSAPFSYSWSNGETTEDINALVAGTYTVTVTDANGCVVSQSFVVSQPTQLTVSGIIGNVSCNGFANGTIVITPNGGTSPYTYLWDDFSTDKDRAGLDVGTYTVTVYDNNNCSTSASFVVTEPDELAIQYVIQDLLCFGENDGEIDITVVGGSAPFSYNWSNGETTEDISNLVAGSYTLTVTDANGCIVSQSFNVSQPSQLVLSGVVGNVSCNGFANGTINITASGGTPAYTFIWSDFATDQNRTGLDVGTYTVTVFDFNNCSTSSSFSITEPDELVVNAIIQDILCYGETDGSIELTPVGGTAPYSFLWSTGETTGILNNLAAGTYTVTVTDTNGCVVVETYNVVQPTQISISGAILNVGCNGLANGTINITVSGGTPAYTYVWSDFSTDEDRTALDVGTYTVIVSDFNNCTATASFEITEPDELLVYGVIQDILCFGETDGSVEVTPIGGTAPYSYNWSTGSTTNIADNLAAGSYTVIVTDSNGCSVTEIYTITQPTQITIDSLIGNVNCNGFANGTIDITANGGTAPYTYVWSDFSTDEDRSGLNVGTYTVTVSDLNNCTATASFTLFEPDELIVFAVIQDILCYGETDGSIEVTPQGGTAPYTYVWSTGETTNIASNLGAGTYTVSVSDVNGCSVIETYVVSQPSQIIISGIIGNVSCNSLANGTISLTVTGGTGPYTYVWSDFSTDDIISGLDIGTYTVTVTDFNNCTETATFTITEPEELVLNSITQNLLCFGDADGYIDIIPFGGTQPYTYVWSNGETTEDITGLVAGTYTVTLTDANLCTISASYVISQPAQLIVTGIIGNVSCNGFANGTINITATGGTAPYSYVWEDFSTDEDRSGLDVGSYTVTVTDLNSCSTSLTFNVIEPEELVLQSVTDDLLCFGDTNGYIDIIPSGGTQPYSFVWSSGQTTEDIGGLIAGTYTVTLTDANACTISGTYVISQPTQLIVTGIIGNVSCNGFANGTIDVTASGGSGSYTYVWSDFDSNEDRTGLDVGTYTVIVSDLNSCTATASFTITEPDELYLQSTVQDLLCFGDNDGSIDVTVFGGTAPFSFAWSNGETTEDIGGLITGTYTVTVTDANGCVVIESYFVNQPTQLLVSGIIGNVSCNGFANGSIDITASGGSGSYTYLWSDFDTNEDRTGLDIGTYTVVVTDLHNCTATASFTVTEPDELYLQATVQDLLCFGNNDGSILITVFGGTSPFTYSWSNGETTSDIFGLVAGTYTVTVTDANGCVVVETYVVTEPTELTVSGIIGNVSCNGFANGTIDITAAGGTGPYVYVWDDFSTDEDRAGLDVGTYTVTVSDFNNCTVTASFTVTEPDELYLQATIQDLFCFGNVDGSIDVTVFGGTSPFSYNWSNGETTEDITGLTAGTYTVMVTDANGCVVAETYIVTQPTQLEVTGTTVDVSCNGFADGTIDVTASGGTAPYTYVWSDFSTDEDRTGLDIGTYTVTVSDLNNCTVSTSFTITQPDTLIATAVTDTVTCFGGNDGSINLSVTGGTSPYSFLWSNGETTEDIIALATGTYTVTVTDSHFCVTTLAVFVFQNDQLTIAPVQINVGCNGGSDGSVDLNVSGGIAPYYFLWDNGETTETAVNLTAGIHCVTVTDSVGCDTVLCFTITEPNILTVTSMQVNDSCFGAYTGSATAIPNGGTAPYFYSWTTFPVQTTQTATGLHAGVYTCNVVDSNGCLADVVVQILQPDSFFNIISVTNVVCAGDSTGDISVATSGGNAPYTYLWNNGSTTADLNDIPAGTYTLTVTDAYGCIISEVIAVTEPPLISFNPVISDVTCYGGSNGQIIPNVTGGTGNLSYLWNTNPAQTTATAINLTAGTYTLLVTDASGCTKTASFVVNQPDSIALNAVLTQVGCFGGNDGSIVLNISGGVSPYTVLWSDGSTNTSLLNLYAGVYTATVTDSHNCTMSQTFNITEPFLLQATIAVNNVSCFGLSNGTVTVNISGGTPAYSYLWNTGATNNSLIGIPAGTYTVTVTDVNGCTVEAIAVVTEPPSLVVGISSVDVLCFGDATGSATANPSGGTPSYDYSWIRILPTISGVLANTQTINGLTAGTYLVTVTDSHGCTETATAVITEPSAPLAISSVTTNVSCNGGSNGQISVTVTGGTQPYGYLWNTVPPQTTAIATGLLPGAYTVLVTDANGCTISATYIVTQPTALVLTKSKTNVNCNGGSNGTATVVASGATPPYIYLWNNGATVANATGLVAGTYTVTVTDFNGCTKTATLVVTQPSAIVGLYTVTQPTCNGSTNGIVDVTISGGTAPYSYLWNTGATTQDLNGVGGGIYTLTITDNKGCVLVVIANVINPPALALTFNVKPVSCFGGVNGSVTVSTTGGKSPYTYLWSTSQTTATISGLAAGTYTVTVTDKKGCTLSSTVVVTQPTLLVCNAGVVQNVSCANGHNGRINVTVSGGTAPYTYLWNTVPVATTVQVNNLAPGTYTVIVTDKKGCTTSCVVTLVNPAPIVLTKTSTNVSCNGGNNGTATITATGGNPGYTYLWNTVPLTTTATATGLSSGSYVVTVTDLNGCTKSATFNITQPAAMTVTATHTNVVCNGASTATITATVTGGFGPYSYTLNPVAITNGTGVFTGVAAGTYSVTVTDFHGCTASVNGIDVTQPTALTMAPATGTNILCFGATTGSATAGVVNGGLAPYTYLWSSVPSQSSVNALNLGAGVYTVTVTDANGCSVTSSVTLTQPLAPISITMINVNGVSCNSTANGSATASVTGGTAPYSYNWDNGQTTATATNLTSGQHLVTVTDDAGCQLVGSVQIGQPGVFVITPILTNVTCYGSSNGSITVNVSGGTSPYTYIIGNDTNTTGVFNGLAAGGYVIIVYDANGCSSTETALLIEPAELIHTFQITDANCNGATNGTAIIYVAGGIAPYTFSWSNGATSDSISNLAAGTHYVTVTDAFGCSFVDSIVIGEPSAILITQSIVNVNCGGAATGSATANPSGGTSPYWFNWSDGQITATASNLAAGTYTVTVTDFNGCSSTSVFTVGQNSSLTVTKTTGTILCNGGTTSIDVSVTGGVGPYNYLWSNNATLNASSNSVGAGLFNVIISDQSGCTAIAYFTVTEPTPLIYGSTVTDVTCNGAGDGQVSVTASGGTPGYTYQLGNSSNNTGLFTGLSGGSYNIVITDANGCSVTTTNLIVNEPLSLLVDAQLSLVSCGNYVANTFVNGGTSPYSYLWSNLATTSSLSGLSAGTYTVIVTDAHGCVAVDSVEVPVVVALTCSTTSTDATCAGYQNGTATVVAAGGYGGYTYVWNSAPNQTTAVATGLPAGNYSVTVTDLFGCTSVCSVVVSEPAPLAFAAIPTGINCYGANSGSILLTVVGGTTPYSYLWSDGQTTATATGLVAGTYNYTITDNNGCSVQGTSILNQPVLLTCNTSTTPATCGSANGTATANAINGTGPYSYQWSNGQGTQDATNLVAGIYTVVVTDVYGCSSQCTAIVNQATSISYALNAVNPLCASGNDGTISIAGLSGGTAPYSYLWSNGATTANPGLLSSGTYTVTVTDINGCLVIQSASLVDPTAVSIAFSQVDVSCFGLSNGSATANPSGGTGTNYGYLWSTGANISVINNLVAGTYTVTVSDNNGCSVSASVVITQPALLDTLSSSVTAATCGDSNGTASVIATGGTGAYSYSWSTVPVQTTQTATGLAAGSHLVTITDANGCVVTVSVTVPGTSAVSLNLVSPVYAGGFNIRCNGGSDGAINLTPSGGGPYTYLWNNGSTTEDQFGVSAGTYTVTVSNGGCTSTASITLSQSPMLIVSATASDNACFGGSIGTATANPTGGVSPYSYVWSTSPAQTTATATGLIAGTYTVTVSDANGCTNTASVVVSQPANALNISAVFANPSCAGGSNGAIDITVTGGTPPYTYIWIDGATTEDRTNMSAGNHTVTATDANGCSVSMCPVLVDPAPLQLGLNTVNPGCNGGATGNITTSVLGGTPPYSYLWTNGALTAGVTGLAPGIYGVTVTDAHGCTITGTTSIITATGFTLNMSKTDATVYGGNNGTATVSIAGGGTAPFTYVWNTVPVQTTSTATGLTAGVYQVVVTDANACTSSGVITVNQPLYLCNPVTRPWRTETIATWIVTPNGNPNQSGQYLTNNFAAVFPSGLVVGGGGCPGNKTLTLTSDVAVRNFLTGQPNTTAAILAANVVDPTSGTLANKLAAQLVALTLNAQFDLANPAFAPGTTVPLTSATIIGLTGSLTIFNGMTVGQFIAQANNKLGACTATPSGTPLLYANAAEQINLAYTGGLTVNGALLQCPSGNNKAAATPDLSDLNALIYPNPSTGMINLTFDAATDCKLQISLYDATGRLVWSKTENAFEGTNQRMYNFDHLSKAVYMMELRMNDRQEVKRIVLQ